MILGFPKCFKHDGLSLMENITGVTDTYINPVQLTDTSCDGAYQLCKVGEKIDEHYGIESTIHDHDLCHAAATVDTALRKDERFAWLNKITEIISSSFKFINCGMEWERFFKTCEAMKNEGYDFKVKVPLFFSETRFANHACKVYQ